MSYTYNISVKSNKKELIAENTLHTSWEAAVKAACRIAESLKGKPLALLRNQDDQRCASAGSVVSHVIHLESEVIKVVIHAQQV